MKNPVARASLALACILLLSACGQSGHGPSTWLDRPLHGMHFQLGPVILHAHASDADGISAIHFYVDGDVVAEMDVSAGQFGEAIYQWNPPAAGTYTIHAVGLDANANRGSSSSVVITVGEVVPTRPGPETEAVDTPRPSDTPVQHTPGPGPQPPTSTPTPTPSKTSTPTDIPTVTSTPDNDGPEILVEAFDPIGNMVGGSPPGCDELRIGTHSLWLDDPGGIWSVWANWYTVPSSQTGTVYYSTSNGFTWTGVYGPFTSNGVTMYFNGRANDNYGNYTEFSGSKYITNCIG